MKVLLDTCVIIDFLQDREPFSHTAKKILQAAAMDIFSGYITAKSTSDIYYLTRKCIHNEKETRSRLSQLLTMIGMLDSMADDVFNAIDSDIPDFEDAIMIETASRSAIDCIVTRNEKDFKHSPVKIYSPDEFIKLLENNG